jgi:hypothetical protein
MGGYCLNTGCVPSKALIRSEKILSYSRRAEEFGFKSAWANFDFDEVMERGTALPPGRRPSCGCDTAKSIRRLQELPEPQWNTDQI